MIDKKPECVEVVVARPKTCGTHCAVLGAVCALIIGVYAWSARSGELELLGSAAKDTYYNLLVLGFRAGQLNLKREVPPGLAQLADPYDPLANTSYLKTGNPLFDVSYYKGKLHLYFGVTPALVLFWPYVAVIGHYLLHKDAVVIFFSVGFLAGVGLLWALWRRYFAEVGVWVAVAGALAVGLANFSLACLPRCDVYEVAVSCGYALTMVTLTLVWQAMHATRGRGWWLAGASLAYGLAVGARPSLLLGAVILLVPVAMLWRARGALGQRPQLWTLLLAATGPITAIGLGLLLYNFLRFDDPLEFGQRYQLSPGRQSAIQQFSLGYLWFNFRVCFLEPARWGGRFPFVHEIAVPPLPRGSGGVFQAFGVLTNIPVVWLALAAPLAWPSRLGGARSILRWLLAAVALLFGTCAVTLCLHDSMVLRYEVEFLAPLVLLAAIGIFGLERALAGRWIWRLAARCGWGLLLAFSVSFNLFAMFGLSSEYYTALGAISFRKGQVDEAVGQFQKALKLQPDNAQANNNLAVVLFEQGKMVEAVGHLEQAVRLNPKDADACYNLGMALFGLGRVTEAVGQYEQALRLDPEFAEARNKLGVARLQVGEGLAAQGKWEEAIAQYQQVVQLKPDDPQVYDSLGLALSRLGRYTEAVEYYRKALTLEPGMATAQVNLAWMLATCVNESVRNGARAIEHAEHANRLSGGKDAGILDTLAAAYAEAGRFGDAVRTAQGAMELTKEAGQAEAARRIEGRLQLYQAGRPYHEGVTGEP